MDLVNIGFKAHTGDMDTADKKLNKLAVTGGKVDGTFSSLQKTIGLVGAAMAALGTAKLTSELIGSSEAWKIINNELKTNITSEKELIETRTKLIALSKATVSDLGATVSLYSELYRATEKLNIEQSTILDVTGTLNNLFVAGAKDANTQASAIRQLSQALGTGALRGDEYISVTEAAPRVIDALAESLNMAKGEMRDFAATGGITSEILIKALTDYSDTAQELFDRTDKTYAQSMQNAKTNAIEYAGELDGLGDVINSIGGGIEELSENIDALTDAGGALVGVLALGLTPAMYRYTASLAATATAQLTAGTTATRTAGALGVYTTTAATATVATNALGMATKFLLGPWGLLLAALGTAGAVFVSSKNSADEFTESLKLQTQASDDLLASLQNISKQDLKSRQMEENQKHIDLLYKRAELEAKIAKFSNVNRGGASRIGEWSDELSSVNSQIDIVANNLDLIAEQIMQGVDFNSPFAKADEDAKLATAEYQEWIDEVNGFQTPLDKAIEKVDKFNTALVAGDITLNDAALKYITNASEELAALNEQAEDSPYEKWLNSIVDSSTGGQLQAIAEEMEKVKLAMDMGDLDRNVALDYLDELEKKANELKGTMSGVDMFNGLADGARESLSSIQSLADQGSSEYQKLGVAIQAVNVIQALSAVLNQGSGDPYSAFGRMAAMAGAVAALGVSVGNMTGGDFATSAADNQAAQGNTIWGDKSESIANAIDLTASATSDLVGINTGMLTALNAMTASLASAAAIALSGGLMDDVDVSGNFVKDYTFDPAEALGASFLGDWAGSAIRSFLGGSSKTTDKGIQIQGGTIGGLQDDAQIRGYVETQYKKWRFGSTKTRTDYQSLSDASDQFSLVFSSLADAVYEGATTLGMSAEEATAAINAYNVATTTISLQGLSADAQQTALENVFSSIFDGLSGSVIPYLDEFQQVGEGLGETLARLANEVSVTELLAENLGFTISDKLADPYLFATISNNLSTMIGGLEAFSSAASSFIEAFAPDAVKLEIASNAMTDALSDIGLELPDTTDGFYELMQGLDATTDAGQEQIATLLGLTDTATSYYDLLDDTLGEFNDTLADVSDSLLDAIDDMYGTTYEQAMRSLDEALLLAKNGSYDAAMNLDLNNIAPESSDYTDATQYALAQANTANKMAELAALTGTTKTVAEYQLSESIDQTALLTELKAQQATMNEQIQTVYQQAKKTAEQLANFRLDALPVRITT